MKCRRCGLELSAEDRFCPECGMQVESGYSGDETVSYTQDETVDIRSLYDETVTQPIDPNIVENVYGKPARRGRSGHEGPEKKETPIKNNEKPKKGSVGTVIAIVIAVIMLIAAIGLIAYMFVQKGKSQDPLDIYESQEDVGGESQLVIPEEEVEEEAEEQETQATTAATTQATTQATTEEAKTESSTNKGDYILPDSSTRLIKDSEVSGLSARELRLARNEIYARHGRKFNDQELQAYFNGKSWYKGSIAPDDFIDEERLSKIERTNIKTIEKYEN